MTVKELMKILKELPGDMQIVLSKDSEGNSCSPLEEVTGGIYQESNAYSGYFMTKYFDTDKVNALCFWPVN